MLSAETMRLTTGTKAKSWEDVIGDLLKDVSQGQREIMIEVSDFGLIDRSGDYLTRNIENKLIALGYRVKYCLSNDGNYPSVIIS